MGAASYLGLLVRAGVLGEVTMNTPEGYEEAARKAAERWKVNQTPELKARIIATWRMTKVVCAEKRTLLFRTPQLADIWRAAFKDVPGWDFDFTTDGQESF